MRAFRFGVALVGAAFAVVPLFTLAAAAPDSSEQTRIEQAIRANESTRQAAELRAKDQLIGPRQALFWAIPSPRLSATRKRMSS